MNVIKSVCVQSKSSLQVKHPGYSEIGQHKTGAKLFSSMKPPFSDLENGGNYLFTEEK